MTKLVTLNVSQKCLFPKVITLYFANTGGWVWKWKSQSDISCKRIDNFPSTTFVNQGWAEILLWQRTCFFYVKVVNPTVFVVFHSHLVLPFNFLCLKFRPILRQVCCICHAFMDGQTDGWVDGGMCCALKPGHTEYISTTRTVATTVCSGHHEYIQL